MGNKVSLKLDERTVRGKKVSKLRKDGIVPSVVYGADMEPVSTQSPHNILEKVIYEAGYHTPVQLTIGSKKRLAMVKDVEWDVVKHKLNHVSFHSINQNDPVVTEVPIRLSDEGESEAEREGLVVLQSLERIEIKALPSDLPESLHVSVKGLKESGDRLTVADIKLPDGVEYVVNLTGREDEDEEAPSVTDLTIASVYEPSALQAANDDAGGDAEEEDAEEVASDNGGEDSQESKSSDGDESAAE